MTWERSYFEEGEERGMGENRREGKREEERRGRQMGENRLIEREGS